MQKLLPIVTAALLIFFPFSAFAAIAYDSASNGGVSVGSPLTYSFTNTAGNFVVVEAFTSTADTMPTATYNGVSMTQGDTQNPFGNRRITTFYLVAPATGAHNVVVSTNNNSFVYSVAASYSGVDQTNPIDSHNTTSFTGTSGSASTNVVAANSWLVAIAASNNGNDLGAGSGTTLRANRSSGYVSLLDSNGTVGTGSQSLNFTGLSDSYGVNIFSIQPTAAVTKPFIPPMIMSWW